MQRDEYFGLVQDLQSFNPHPARRPDATSVVVTPVTRTVDWFQSSSGQKAGCNYTPGAVVNLSANRVSILIRPEGRMQPDVGTAVTATDAFQSSSGQKAGCNALSVVKGIPAGFNPHPARRPDATLGQGFEPVHRRSVSILIRPEGRMQLIAAVGTGFLAHQFQSSSGQKAGCNALSSEQ